MNLARTVNGEFKNLSKYSDYSQLEHTLARRTFDESGDYEVRPFKLEKREHLNDGTNRGVFATGGGLKVKLHSLIEIRQGIC